MSTLSVFLFLLRISHPHPNQMVLGCFLSSWKHFFGDFHGFLRPCVFPSSSSTIRPLTLKNDSTFHEKVTTHNCFQNPRLKWGQFGGSRTETQIIISTYHKHWAMLDTATTPHFGKVSSISNTLEITIINKNLNYMWADDKWQKF